MTSMRILASLALLFIGCDTATATMVVVNNDYPALADGGDPSQEISVFKVWWATSIMPDAVAPGGEGDAQRTVPSTDFAYAVLAVGWDPSSSDPPTKLIAAKTSAKLTVARGDTLNVHVADATFVGNCAAGKPLSQDDADFITQRIFPDEFAGSTYDARTCAAVLTPVDAGVDGGVPDGGVADAGGFENAAD